MATCSAPSVDQMDQMEKHRLFRGDILSTARPFRPDDAEARALLKEGFESLVPAHYCYDPDFDFHLLGQFVELMGMKAEVSLVAAMSVRFGCSKFEIEAAVKLVLEGLRLLHLCKYPNEDIQVVVAHASSYLMQLMGHMKEAGQPEMGLTEITHVFVLLLYLAHSFCEDETCPISVWHERLFQKYCDLATLNDALMRLMRKLAFTLRVSEEDLTQRLAFLRAPYV